MNDNVVGDSTLRSLNEGDPVTAADVWMRFQPRLVRYASSLMHKNRRTFDCEDVIQNAFLGVLADRGKALAKAESTQHVWNIFAQRIHRKLIDMHRRESAQERGSGRIRGESAFQPAGERTGDGSRTFGIANAALADDDATAVAVSNEIWMSMKRDLPSDEFRTVMTMLRDGYTKNEIAEKLGVSRHTIYRRIAIIQDCWKELDE